MRRGTPVQWRVFSAHRVYERGGAVLLRLLVALHFRLTVPLLVPSLIVQTYNKVVEDMALPDGLIFGAGPLPPSVLLRGALG